MEEKKRCQSCGMPLGPEVYGSESDGSESHEYCKHCRQNGVFTMPEMTLEQAVQSSIEYMRKKTDMDEDQAAVMANAVIPTLKRWRTHEQ